MKSRVFALVLGLATGWIGVGTSAKAFEFNGSWATAASSCGQVFVKKDGVISFRQDSDQYGGGFSWKAIESAAKCKLVPSSGEKQKVMSSI